MKTKEYTITEKCYSLRDSEIIRDQIHEEFQQKLIDKNVPFAKITSQVLFDYIAFECIVKITITY